MSSPISPACSGGIRPALGPARPDPRTVAGPERIERAEGLTQAQLADDLDLEPIAVGRVIDRLEAAGFVERRADPDDRRCWRLYLASKSAEVMVEMKSIAAVLRDDVLVGVSAEDFAVTMRVLAKVKDTLNELDRDGRQAGSRK